MDPLEDVRQRLEGQVNEFFSPTTTNDVKKQIGVLLDNYSRAPGSWKQTLHFLSKPQSFNNEYLVMYCITVIEDSVKNRWRTMMSLHEQTELQTTLYTFLIEHASSSSSVKCPHFIRNKIIKILTDIGKFSWCEQHPEFMDNVFKLVMHEDTVVIGLIFLKTISEEWSNCKDEIDTERKLKLINLLNLKLEKIFDVIHQILVAGLKHSYAKNGSGDPMINPAMKEVLALSLETCAHFFTWISLDGVSVPGSFPSQNRSKVIPFAPEFVTVLCQYAGSDLSASVNAADGVKSLSILGLNCLNELLYRKYVPKDFDSHLNLVTNFAIDLLFKMQSGMGSNTVTNKYLDKGIEFLCLIAITYFFRYDQKSSKQFATLLLNFTFAQTETAFYYECLVVWKNLLHLLISEVPFANFSCREDVLENFKPILLDLALGVVNSTLKFEIDDEGEFYDDEEDEDDERMTLSKNIDILVKIGELLPSESIERVTSTWISSCQFFESLQSKLDQNKTSVILENPINVKHFNFIVQLMGRIAEIFYHDVFKNEIDSGKQIVQQLLNLMIISKNFYFVQSSEVLIQANCEIVYALRTWSYWLSRYFSEVVLTDGSEADAENFYKIITVSADGLRFCLDNHATIHPTIIFAHANFFSLMVNGIRSKHIFKLLPWVQTLIEKIHSLQQTLSTDTFRVLNKSVAILLLLPWQSCSYVEQEWDNRTRMYNEYMKHLKADLLSSTSPANNDVAKLLLTIRLLNDQIDILQTECAVSKKVCWAVIEEIIQFVHKLVPVYIKKSDVSEELLNFFLKIMSVLRQQAGPEFFESTIRILMQAFSSANIINDLMNNDSESSSIVVEKFLNMLEFMIKDPSPTFRKFLPDCLSVALDHIYPVLAQRPSPDVKLVFFQFLRDAVNFRWNYFFPGFLLASDRLTSDSPPSSLSEEDPASVEASRRLYQIFETLGQSFLQSDLEVFRFNLNTLSVWNQKHQIYNRMAIDLKMFDGFLAVLIQVLARKSHDLLREEIAFNLYEMSIVDFSRFWQVFLPQTLQKDFPLLTLEQRTFLAGKFKPKQDQASTPAVWGGASFGRSASGDKVDFATFTMTLYRFIDDLRFYHFFDECIKMITPTNHNHNEDSGSSGDVSP